MTSGKPTTARINNAAMTRNKLNRSAAFHVNHEMARILCINIQKPQMDTDETQIKNLVRQLFPICVSSVKICG